MARKRQSLLEMVTTCRCALVLCLLVPGACSPGSGRQAAAEEVLAADAANDTAVADSHRADPAPDVPRADTRTSDALHVDGAKIVEVMLDVDTDALSQSEVQATFCGNDTCDGDETCAGCPSDCGPLCCEPDGCKPGLECKDGTCKAPCFPSCEPMHCGSDHCGGTCLECPPSKPACSVLLGTICVEDYNCMPNCKGVECGDDGCGGSCGVCPGTWHCQYGVCVPLCTPQCLIPPKLESFKECGWDECPGQHACGICPDGQHCGEGFLCADDFCSCEGMECGSTGVGCPSCGDCPQGDVCDAVTFKCVPCLPSCLNDDGNPKECGDDGCGGSCGVCPPELQCHDEESQGVCGSCIPQCQHPTEPFMPILCGPNSCPPGCMDKGLSPCQKMSDCISGHQCNALTGMCVACGSCGSCPPGWACDVETQFTPDFFVCDVCAANCLGKECGNNGCGGACGYCPPNFTCIEDQCL